MSKCYSNHDFRARPECRGVVVPSEPEGGEGGREGRQKNKEIKNKKIINYFINILSLYHSLCLRETMEIGASDGFYLGFPLYFLRNLKKSAPPAGFT